MVFKQTMSTTHPSCLYRRLFGGKEPQVDVQASGELMALDSAVPATTAADLVLPLSAGPSSANAALSQAKPTPDDEPTDPSLPVGTRCPPVVGNPRFRGTGEQQECSWRSSLLGWSSREHVIHAACSLQRAKEQCATEGHQVCRTPSWGFSSPQQWPMPGPTRAPPWPGSSMFFYQCTSPWTHGHCWGPGLQHMFLQWSQDCLRGWQRCGL